MVTPTQVRRSGAAAIVDFAARSDIARPLKAVSSSRSRARCTLHLRFTEDYAAAIEQGQRRHHPAGYDPAPQTRVCRMSNIRLCRDSDREAILAIINAAASAYRGVIPADRWHEPYMAADELDNEMAAGVAFWGCEQDGALVGVMGLQSVRDVDLIRHAYVLPESQRGGVGGALLL